MSDHEQVSAGEWDSVRSRFEKSMMARTEIHKLAQNIGASWPIKGADEVSAKYLPLPLEELAQAPGIAGRPERIRLLVDILSETMAFDEPFGEMAEQVDSSSRRDDQARRVLAQLEVPLDYPLRLCALSSETLKFCEQEQIATLGEFADFSQNLAQSVVVGGDFRAFLNAMAHPEEAAIARFIPLRPGRKGLHLAEALGQQADQLSPTERRIAAGKGALKGRELALKESARSHTRALLEWFEEEAEELRTAFRRGPAEVQRFFGVLQDAERERLAATLAERAIEGIPARGNFLKRLFGS